ncbi:hypothetical protein [Polaromonas sp.]|uniref:hypothetical protein n=1 Tax=Polaromonas sp. TaxID=1869339 RepID=UPI00286D1016|nr:hypothetical protein [Polaromonas sp.]
MTAWCAVVLAFLLSVGSAKAFDFSGNKSLIAVTRDGGRTRIGSVSFVPAMAGSASFRVQMDYSVMRDYFLSMKEFKCLPSAVEVTCHVAYPYRQPATASASDPAWLEHNLLFLYKQPADFGAKLWNGLIFSFSVTPNALVGRPQAVDLNLVSAPPDKLDSPPFGPMDRNDVAPGERWLSELRIE